MHTFTYPKPHFPRLFGHISDTSRRLAGWAKEWVMLRQIGWTATIALAGLLIWYCCTDVSVAPKVVASGALAVIGLLSGLHIGSHSTAAYIKDIQRMNKALADQNVELEKANAMLLRELSMEFDPPARSQSA